jgi:hypothetical protein
MFHGAPPWYRNTGARFQIGGSPTNVLPPSVERQSAMAELVTPGSQSLPVSMPLYTRTHVNKMSTPGILLGGFHDLGSYGIQF